MSVSIARVWTVVLALFFSFMFFLAILLFIILIFVIFQLQNLIGLWFKRKLSDILKFRLVLPIYWLCITVFWIYLFFAVNLISNDSLSLSFLSWCPSFQISCHRLGLLMWRGKQITTQENWLEFDDGISSKKDWIYFFCLWDLDSSCLRIRSLFENFESSIKKTDLSW